MNLLAHLRQLRLTLGIAILAMLLPLTAQATAYELSRLASRLNFTSTRLAEDLRNSQGYSSVRFSAQRLGREAEQLVESISRDRSHAYIRSQLDDVRHRYEDLEKAVLRIDGGRHQAWVFEQMDSISALYESLNAEFYYQPRNYPPVRHYYPNPGIIISGQRILPRSYQPRQQHEQEDSRRDRRDYGRITTHRGFDFDHSSPVLERQRRLDNQRHQLQHQTETRRRNHYE